MTIPESHPSKLDLRSLRLHRQRYHQLPEAETARYSVSPIIRSANRRNICRPFPHRRINLHLHAVFPIPISNQILLNVTPLIPRRRSDIMSARVRSDLPSAECPRAKASKCGVTNCPNPPWPTQSAGRLSEPIGLIIEVVHHHQQHAAHHTPRRPCGWPLLYTSNPPEVPTPDSPDPEHLVRANLDLEIAVSHGDYSS